MLILTAYVPDAIVGEVCRELAQHEGVRHIAAGPVTTDGRRVVSGRVAATATDVVVGSLGRWDLGPDDVYLSRSDSVRPLAYLHGRRAGAKTDGRARAEVLEDADDNSRIRTTFLLNMVAAGVIAGVGVLTGSAILVVGAMAISPDLLPIIAIAIGLAEGRWRLTGRAALVLLVGLAVGAVAAFGAVRLLRIFNQIDDDLTLGASVLGPSLTQLGPGSVLVAAAAGMAGMLALARVGGAVTGVAISVTTIPAAAYIGGSFAIEGPHTSGALWVLAINVVVMVLAAFATLVAQRRWRSTLWRPASGAATPRSSTTP